ncbi:anti-sigma factor [Chitinophaga sp. Cy-1792]|uniref:anti-sigma factor n=1 Tax=Chitinophaga sp. Cy-1792 TaxID=2608339 RepID=UPI001423075E
MDINRYIASGILESYVYGLLPENESTEVEVVATQYPEVRTLVNSLQLEKERYTRVFSVAPPPELKNRLLDILQHEKTTEGELKLPEELRLDNPTIATTPAPVTPIKKLPADKKKAQNKAWKLVAAATILVLLGSIGMNVFFFNNGSDYKGRYEKLIAANDKLQKARNDPANQTASYKENGEDTDVSMLDNPALIQVKLKGNASHPGTAATVAWNPVSKEVFLLVQHLPDAPSGKQFQLWAIKEHQMQDAGIIKTDNDGTHKIQHMKTIPAADAFAVTLEPSGGSTQPTMTSMFMAATVKK